MKMSLKRRSIEIERLFLWAKTDEPQAHKAFA